MTYLTTAISWLWEGYHLSPLHPLYFLLEARARGARRCGAVAEHRGHPVARYKPNKTSMPEPLSPPPTNEYGAVIQPRQLQRWLDINNITQLTRTQAYITLPTFSQPVTWNGYSDIVAAFNYEGPNNFTLVSPPAVISPNYVLCIMWTTSGTVYRYSLWRGVGEVINFNIPMYAGQKIGKNFRFEVWSTPSTPAVQATTLQFYTSVLGNVDYRYGCDFTLVSADPEVTNFACPVNPTQGLTPPLTPSGVTLYNWFRADTGVSGETWTPKQGTGFLTSVLTNSSAIVTGTNPYIKGSKYIQNIGATGVTNTNDPNDIWLLFQYVADDSDGYILYTVTSGTSILSIHSGVLSADGNSFGNTALTVNHWYVIRWSTVTSTSTSELTIWPVVAGALTASNYQFQGMATSNARTNSSVMIVGEFSDINVADLVIYSNIISGSDLTAMLNYWNDHYLNLYNLPLTFPANSSPTPN